VRERGEKVVPLCSFVASHIRRHPEHHDLLADGGR
jgi:predicted GNAT family acetyltransferase